ncbi:zinc/iron-chelating domain-containing protein [Helicobacter didelphidarum]|uniref:Zinc/iron-chelating domain-containing protein n=1 Tax=Helicobacter didelphidarum TaxID=2040648 RepID=A0A3D8IP74_9HELI|nr:YkgJ family cysteine cluster protein [Helicobacter didelphidarum]RDU67022.1 zinc/iron-chelating domain-containing protein [Helicobacter didelphidarum]
MQKEIQSHKDNNQKYLIHKEGYYYTFNPSKCSECGGKCCYGESGYIFVTIHEMKTIAKFLNISLEELALKYVKKVGYRFSFIEKDCQEQFNGVSCIFFNETTKECNIYSVRPKQCRTFPFWNIYQKNNRDLLQRCIGVILLQSDRKET